MNNLIKDEKENYKTNGIILIVFSFIISIISIIILKLTKNFNIFAIIFAFIPVILLLGLGISSIIQYNKL